MKKQDFEKVSYRAEYGEIMDTLKLRRKYAVSSRRKQTAIFLLVHVTGPRLNNGTDNTGTSGGGCKNSSEQDTVLLGF